MRILRLPGVPKALLFDVDSTLYTRPDYASFQNEVLVRELALSRNEPFEDALTAVEAASARIRVRTGKSTSLGNALAELGVSLPVSVEWRERLIRPEDWLTKDEKLLEVLTLLSGRYSLAAVTNNPRAVGLASLEALGVAACFRAVVGLDDTMVSKPARAPFELAARLLNSPPESCVSVGDRYDVDLAVPLDLGMGAVLVDGVEDVYNLPGILSSPGQV